MRCTYLSLIYCYFFLFVIYQPFKQEIHTVPVSDGNDRDIGEETEGGGGVTASNETLRHLISSGTLNWDVTRRAASQVVKTFCHLYLLNGCK